MSDWSSREPAGWVDPGGRTDPRAALVHLLRATTVDLDLLAGEFAATHRLHPTDLRALVHLLDAARDERVATPGRLGEWMGMSSPAITPLVDRLERRGLVRRVRDEADRRRVRLVVSDEAVALGWSFFGPVITRAMQAMDAFDEAQLATVHRFLTEVRAVLAGSREHATTNAAR